MELPGAPFGPVDNPDIADIPAYKIAWKAWYEKNKSTLAD